MFTRDGAAAYKFGLGNIVALCEALDNPHKKFKSIHIAGTNGKGSTSHMVASILQEAGYKVGLYTSPHIVDFRERIRINGAMIAQEKVSAFVQVHQQLIASLQASFFEITVALAFDYFAEQQVDVAVVEVGLGGLYDSTNIISPELSVITNIGMDHMNLLGNTLAEIASQKAGIIKSHTPVVISTHQESIAHVFAQVARQHEAPLYIADEVLDVISLSSENTLDTQCIKVVNRSEVTITRYDVDLLGKYQLQNIKGVLMACIILQQNSWHIETPHIQAGLQKVRSNTGLRGRYEVISTSPLVICDVAHNYDGIASVLKQVATANAKQLHIVLGFVSDKDVNGIIPLLPQDAFYYCTQAQIPRAMPYLQLQENLCKHRLNASAFAHVNDAYKAATEACGDDEIVLVIGSFFILSELSAFCDRKQMAN
jgi:dihydrofolate synthase / folylpolyglutamate synthase